MKERLIVSATTLVVSLLCYFYAIRYSKDMVPYVMIGSFMGAAVGEAIANFFNKDKSEGQN